MLAPYHREAIWPPTVIVSAATLNSIRLKQWLRANDNSDRVAARGAGPA
jgi:hypothetical protein